MEKEYWHSKWSARDTAFDQDTPNPFLIEFFGTLNLKPKCSILVPLAGKTIDMMWLSTRGYRVVGVELNELACRRFFVENNLKFTEYEHGGFRVFQSDSIQLYCGDFFLCTRDLVGKIGAIYDRAALVALPPAMRERYAEHIRALSCEGVQILLLSVAYDQMQMNGPPFSVSEDEIKRLFVPRFEIERLYYKVACEVPPHFKAKGLITLREAVYRLF